MEVDGQKNTYFVNCVMLFPKAGTKKEVNVELDSWDISVENLKSVLNKLHQIKDTETIELLNRGSRMNDSDTLTMYNLLPTSKLQAIIKSKPAHAEDPAPNQSRIADAKRDLKTLMTPKNYKTAYYLLNKPDTIKNMVSEIPNLGHDVTARVLVKNVRLIKVMLKHTDTQHRDKLVDNILRKHPSIIEAIPLLHQLVISTENIPKSDLQSNNYYLDAQSDDDEDTPMRYVQTHMAANQGQAPPIQAQAAAAGQNITISQLQSALLNATRGAGGSTSGQQPASSSQTQQPATQATGLNPFSALQNPAETYKSQLEQLHAMGIHDDAVAMQALVATNGNLQQALEIIYGSM